MLELGFNAAYLAETGGQIVFDNDSNVIIFGMLPEKRCGGIDDLVNPDDLIIIL